MHLNNGILPFTTAWMEMESIMLSEISQAVKDKYHMVLPVSGTYKQTKDKQAKKNQRHGNKEQTDNDQRGWGRGVMGERRGRVKSRNMDKDLGSRTIEWGLSLGA